MSYAISVPTPFNDISELAESFHSRVDEERLMLPNPDAVPEGEWVDFAVTLADGSAALAGQGRCTGSFDNGEDRAPEHRFDVVMDSLRLDGMAQIFFDRILQVRAAYAGDEPATGETELPEDPPEAERAPQADLEVGGGLADEYGEPADEHAMPADEYAADPHAVEALEAWGPSADEYAPPVEDLVAAAPVEVAAVDDAQALAFDDDPGVEDLESIDAPLDEEVDAPAGPDRGLRVVAPALSAPTESRIYDLPPPTAPGALPSPHGGDAVLTRPFLHATWSPEPAPRFDPSPSSGYFQYAVGAGLPRPAEPPRPDLDPSLRLVPAPRPGDAYVAPSFDVPAAAPAAYVDPGQPEAGYADEGDYAEQDAYSEPTGGAYGSDDDGYVDEGGLDLSDDATLDVVAHEADAGNEDAETRQHDVSALPDDEELGIETLQVGIPDDD